MQLKNKKTINLKKQKIKQVILNNINEKLIILRNLQICKLNNIQNTF